MRVRFRFALAIVLGAAGCIPDVVPTAGTGSTGTGGAGTTSTSASSSHASASSTTASSGATGGGGGHGGAGGATSSTGGSGGSGGNGGATSTTVASTTVSSSTGPTCISSGAGGSGACGGGEWAHWNPSAPKTYTLDPDTVTDPTTGLIWQRDAVFLFPGYSAADYCHNLDLDGCSTGWRLPTRIELLSIVDYTRDTPATDPVAFPSTAASYWSSTPYPSAANTYYTVSFDSGRVGYADDQALARARCVR